MSPQSNVWLTMLKPWMDKVEKESGGRIKFEGNPAMQLGGTPVQFYDQAKDGVVNVVWTLPGNTAGRFLSISCFSCRLYLTVLKQWLISRKGQSLYTSKMTRPPIQYCSRCGATVQHRVPADGDTKMRAVCSGCQTVHYENPLNVVGTVCTWGIDAEQVLLCKRNIEPRWGKWTLPAGFMELDETTSEGAARETTEEAGAQFEMQDIFALMNVAKVGQLHLFYRAKLLSTEFDPGFETIEAKLFHESEIPWDEIAFQTVRETLKFYFADQKKGSFTFHVADIN